jgi:mono/diheme cytochrome c family protein
MRRISLLLTLLFTLVGCGNHKKTSKDAPYLTATGWVFPDGSTINSTAPGASPASEPVGPASPSSPLTPTTTPADPATPVGLPGDPTPVVPGPPLGGATPTAVSFAQAVQPIFTANCVTCHGAGGSQPVLTTGSAYEAIVGRPSPTVTLNQVEPGNSALSYLFRKVSGTHLSVGGSGSRMPAGMNQLPQAEISILQSWIDAGAPNN